LWSFWPGTWQAVVHEVPAARARRSAVRIDRQGSRAGVRRRDKARVASPPRPGPPGTDAGSGSEACGGSHGGTSRPDPVSSARTPTAGGRRPRRGGGPVGPVSAGSLGWWRRRESNPRVATAVAQGIYVRVPRTWFSSASRPWTGSSRTSLCCVSSSRSEAMRPDQPASGVRPGRQAHPGETAD
jgi:hypothetical protein